MTLLLLTFNKQYCLVQTNIYIWQM